MGEHWKEIRITWQEDGDERLFKDGLREVTIKQFIDGMTRLPCVCSLCQLNIKAQPSRAIVGALCIHTTV